MLKEDSAAETTQRPEEREVWTKTGVENPSSCDGAVLYFAVKFMFHLQAKNSTFLAIKCAHPSSCGPVSQGEEGEFFVNPNAGLDLTSECFQGERGETGCKDPISYHWRVERMNNGLEYFRSSVVVVVVLTRSSPEP